MEKHRHIIERIEEHIKIARLIVATVFEAGEKWPLCRGGLQRAGRACVEPSGAGGRERRRVMGSGRVEEKKGDVRGPARRTSNGKGKAK